MKIAIIGAGNVGTALKTGLSRTGHEGTAGREDNAAHVAEAAELVILAVPFAEVGNVPAGSVASAEIEAAGGELLGQITRVEEMGCAYRHFRGRDGRIYGLNEQSRLVGAECSEWNRGHSARSALL